MQTHVAVLMDLNLFDWKIKHKEATCTFICMSIFVRVHVTLAASTSSIFLTHFLKINQLVE